MAWKPDPAWLPDPDPTPQAGHRASTLELADEGVDATRPLPKVANDGWRPDTSVVAQWRKNRQPTAPSKPPREPKPAREPKPVRNWKMPSPPLLAAGAGLGVVALLAVAAGVYALSGSDTSTPSVPTATAAPSPVIATIPVFCPDTTKGQAVTTSGRGTDTTAAGVIAALDYAYYTQRDAERVNALMVAAPSSVAAIQAAIDAVPAGTKACVTATPDTAPGVWLVDVQLHAPTGRDTWLHQRITLAAQSGASGPRFKIARIEDRQTP